jgi:hypothetical protein
MFVPETKPGMNNIDLKLPDRLAGVNTGTLSLG